MNLELLKETLCQNYPEVQDGTIDYESTASTIQFNKLGTLLAVGCVDGRVTLWDFMTRGIAKVIVAHAHPIQSVSWSRNGHKILTASTDHLVKIFDVVSGDCEYHYRFFSAVLRAQFHPRNPKLILVTPFVDNVVLLNMETNVQSPVPLEDGKDCIVASFDRRGDHIYTGNSKGKITVYSIPGLELIANFKIAQGGLGSTGVKSLEFARRGDSFLVSSADRILRVYNCEDVLSAGTDGNPEPLLKIQDLINKSTWKKCCFSGDGEYICAGSEKQHQLYIWEKGVGVGNVATILGGVGSKVKQLTDLVWHPLRPVIASVSGGVVCIWAQRHVENWSAFQPDFKELDENVEHEERESEYDAEDEDKEKYERSRVEEEDDSEELVDVTTCDPIGAYMSSDEEGEDKDFLMFIPISPDINPDVDERAALKAKEESVAGSSGRKGATARNYRK